MLHLEAHDRNPEATRIMYIKGAEDQKAGKPCKYGYDTGLFCTGFEAYVRGYHDAENDRVAVPYLDGDAIYVDMRDGDGEWYSDYIRSKDVNDLLSLRSKYLRQQVVPYFDTGTSGVWTFRVRDDDSIKLFYQSQ